MMVAIVIPAHNEEEVIAHTVKSLEEKLGIEHEVIVVNDHSLDNTAAVVKDLMKQYPNLKLVDNDRGRGFASALRKGFSVSNSELIVPLMADSCDTPETIKDMLARAKEGFDIVVGSRYMTGGKKSGGPRLQSFFSRFVGRSLRFIIGIPTCDVSNSFKCYRKGVLDAIKCESKGFEISMELTLKAFFSGFKITEVPTIWKGREIGKSKFYLLKVAPNYIWLDVWATVANKEGAKD